MRRRGWLLQRASFAQSGNLKRHVDRKHTEAGQKLYQRKEDIMSERLNATYPRQVSREHVIEFDCLGETYARIDFVLHTRQVHGAFVVFIENDEGAHNDRPTSRELSRMLKAQAALVAEGNTHPVIWIRFNCDTCRIDGVRLRVRLADRFKALDALIQQLQKATTPHPPSSVYYLYYDATTRDDGSLQLELFTDKDYNPLFKQLVAGVSVHPGGQSNV